MNAERTLFENKSRDESHSEKHDGPLEIVSLWKQNDRTFLTI